MKNLLLLFSFLVFTFSVSSQNRIDLSEKYAASITALDPAIFAIDDNASIFWAREILGTESIDKTLMLSLAHFFNKSGCVEGLKNDIKV